jgi:hypothetical protein
MIFQSFAAAVSSMILAAAVPVTVPPTVVTPPPPPVASPTVNSTVSNNLANKQAQGQLQGQQQGQMQTATSSANNNNTVSNGANTSVTETLKDRLQAPPIYVSPTNATAPCVIPLAGGASFGGGSIGLSSGYKDDDCKFRNRVVLYASFDALVARAYACDHDPGLIQAYKEVGKDCYKDPPLPPVVVVAAPPPPAPLPPPVVALLPPPVPNSYEQQVTPLPRHHTVHKKKVCAPAFALRGKLGLPPAPKAAVPQH